MLQVLQEGGRCSIVEPPFALFEEEVEVCFGDAVVAAQVPLGLVPEVLNAIDVVVPVFDKMVGVIDPVMVELRDIQNIVGSIAVGIND